MVPESDLWIIVGLGNPGLRYRSSRHNVGFRILDRLARASNIGLSQRRAKAVVGEGEVDGHRVVLAKPRTFMNRSGDAVTYLMDRFRAKPQQILIVYDEMDLPPGRIRIRPGGSAAGHNGLKSIIGAVSTQQFPRLRVGIGKPGLGQDDISFVLGSFPIDENKLVTEATERAVEAALCVVHEGVDQAMNRYNSG
jgi:PTH1 family peptidyl-tRNA hydrolase